MSANPANMPSYTTVVPLENTDLPIYPIGHIPGSRSVKVLVPMSIDIVRQNIEPRGDRADATGSAMAEATKRVIENMTQRARSLGATAIIGFSLVYATNDSCINATAIGTFVSHE